MRFRTIGWVIGLAVLAQAVAGAGFETLTKRVDRLEERLASSHARVRYALALELRGRDVETRRALETLIADKDVEVANQAQVIWLGSFAEVDRKVFRPEVYLPHRFSLDGLTPQQARATTLAYVLGRKDDECFHGNDAEPGLAVLDPSKKDDPEMARPVELVGLLGSAEDVSAVAPFSASANDYVALAAAKAMLRLGDRDKAAAALAQLAGRDPKEHLYYVTEALRVMQEMKHPAFKDHVLKVWEAVKSDQTIQANWWSDFALLAAEVAPGVLK
jgi:hypothetical protein